MTTTPSSLGPHITADTLIAGLTDAGIDVASIVNQLGSGATLNEIEIELERRGVLSREKLLAVLQIVSGLPVVTAHDVPVAALPADIARNSGAIGLDGPVPRIAMVEDTPANLRTVRDAIHVEFNVVLMTAAQFSDLYRAVYVAPTVEETAPEAASLEELLDAGLAAGCSDIHLSSGRAPSIRTANGLTQLEFAPVSNDWLHAEFDRFVGSDKMREHAATNNADIGRSFRDVRLRINLGAASNGMTAAIRRLPSAIPSFDELALPASVRDLVNAERGLVLVTGSVGAGKSTTIASLLSTMAQSQRRHIVTLEQPCEYMLPTDGQSLVHQREIGDTCDSFADGLRQALRQDPNVLVVGEARDLDSIRAAVHAAETGVLVFATVHAHDATSTLSRLVSAFPASEQDQIRSSLAYVLRAVVSQTLVPSTSGGRVAAFEILLGSPAVKNVVKKADGLAQLRQVLAAGTDLGMTTMEAYLAGLVKAGTVRSVDAEFFARDVDEFHRQMESGADLTWT